MKHKYKKNKLNYKSKKNKYKKNKLNYKSKKNKLNYK